MPEHFSTPNQEVIVQVDADYLHRADETALGAFRGRVSRACLVSGFIGILAGVVGFHSRCVSAQTVTNPVVITGASAAPSPTSVVTVISTSPNSSVALASGPPAVALQCAPNIGGSQKSDSEGSEIGSDSQSSTANGAKLLSSGPVDTSEMVTKTSGVSYRNLLQFSHTVGSGQTKLVSSGQDGLIEKTYRVTAKASQRRYDLVSQRIVKSPVDMRTLAGFDRGSRVLPSRYGMYNRALEIDMIATGYSPSEGPGHGYCATGMRAGYGVVAVDPRVIPLRSSLYIPGYGFAIAGDTGGAIKGHRIDLGQNTYYEAEQVGRRHVRVYVLSRL